MLQDVRDLKSRGHLVPSLNGEPLKTANLHGARKTLYNKCAEGTLYWTEDKVADSAERYTENGLSPARITKTPEAMQGWVKKKGQINLSWKKRFVLL